MPGCSLHTQMPQDCDQTLAMMTLKPQSYNLWWPEIIKSEYTFETKDLWRVTGQEDINLEIRRRKFRWIGHTLRKEEGEIPKAALLWNPQGSRKRGRPKNS